jgi:hypothetical protein
MVLHVENRNSMILWVPACGWNTNCPSMGEMQG